MSERQEDEERVHKEEKEIEEGIEVENDERRMVSGALLWSRIIEMRGQPFLSLVPIFKVISLSLSEHCFRPAFKPFDLND